MKCIIRRIVGWLMLICWAAKAADLPPLPPIPPGAPWAVHTDSQSETNFSQIILTWNHTNVVDQAITGFLVQHTQNSGTLFTNYFGVPSGWSSGMTNAATNFAMVLPPLQMGLHRFRVLSTNATAQSAPSLEVATPTALPDAPYINSLITVVTTYLNNGPTNSMEFKVLWTPNATDMTNQVEHYMIEHKGPLLPDQPGSEDPNSWTLFFTSYALLNGTIPPNFGMGIGSFPAGVHHFRMRSKNVWGFSPYSNEMISPPNGLPVKLNMAITVTIQ